MTLIERIIDKHPSAVWKARINCYVVAIGCLSCITGHLVNAPILYSFGLSLGMSAFTASMLLLLAVAILLLLREAPDSPEAL